jgi:DNA-binding MarR family transcriptional regulator
MTVGSAGKAAGPDLATGLVRLARLVDGVFARVSGEHDLTATQARVLCILVEQPRGMAELAGLLSIDKAGVTGLVDRIERRGLAERITVPGDRRALRVLLTTAGQRVAVAVHDQVCAELDALTAELTAADQERFRRTIALVAGASGGFPAPPADVRDAAYGRLARLAGLFQRRSRSLFSRLRNRQPAAQHAERGPGDLEVGAGAESRREADRRGRRQVVPLDQAFRRPPGQGEQGDAESGARGIEDTSQISGVADHLGADTVLGQDGEGSPPDRAGFLDRDQRPGLARGRRCPPGRRAPGQPE